jgi:chromosome segregation protein
VRLKRLKIVGFKSFADKTVVNFDQEIVGIVGPNGCGKSNIVDAFRWVLGEQSAKSMRAQAMHDVLFSGCGTRSAGNMAEVSLTFTGASSHLDLPYDELTITRRLHRSGESEYLINKQSVRLRDLHSLLLGSGLGKNAFSVFEQGKIDQVIHLSPLARRGIFDESSGIGRFLERKKESVSKLNRVSENYQRLNDIFQEVAAQTKQLKKQAGAAHSFKEMQERVAVLERGVLAGELDAVLTKLSSKESGILQGQGRTHELKEEIQKLAEQLTSKREALTKEQELSRSLFSERHSLEKEVDVTASRSELTERRCQELKSRLKQLEAERGHFGSEITLLEKQVAESEKDLKVQQEKKEKIENERSELKEAYQKAQNDSENLLKKQRLTQRSYMECVNQEGSLKVSLQQKEHLLETAKSHLKEGSALAKKAESRLEELKSLELSLDKELKELSSEIEAIQKKEQATAKKRQLELKAAEELKKKLQELKGHEKGLQAKAQLLEEMKKSFEGLSKGVKQLVAHKELKGKCHPLIDLIKPKKGSERAVATLLTPYKETLVVTDQESFDLVLSVAQKEKLGGFSLFLQKEKKGKSHPLIEDSPLVAPFFEKAKVTSFPKKPFEVSEEGTFLDEKGVFFLLGKGGAELQLFERARELESLQEELKKLFKEEQKILAEEEKSLKKFSQITSQIQELEKERRQVEMRHVHVNFALQQKRTEIKEAEKEARFLKEKEEKCRKEVESAGKLEEERTALKELQVKVVELKAQAEELEKIGQAAFEKAKELEVVWQKVEEKMSELSQQWHAAKQAFTVALTRLQEKKSRHTGIEKEFESSRKELEEKEKFVFGAIEGLGVKRSRLKELVVLEKEAHKSVKDKEIQLKETTAVHADLEKQLWKLEKELDSNTTSKQELLEQKEKLVCKLFEDQPFNVDAMQQWILDLSQDEASKELQSLRGKMEALGPVNLMAIEAYGEQKDRFEELEAQLKDLEDSKRELEAIIIKLDAESRKVFRSTFKQIRESFQKNFELLFEGGSADLTFTDSSDVLEAGIEIMAKPPGKQPRAITLLSGGEKCLTALALLFALFETRPSPVCILDEVDAPLDESNIGRFTAMLERFTEKTQFLIVTHNKKTMTMAHLLLGVSQEEKGVSKLISLPLPQRKLENVAVS